MVIKRNRKNTRTSIRLLILTAGLSVPLSLAAQTEPTAVDTSNWSCEYCPEYSGWYGDVYAGVQNISDDSAKFGDYTGLNEDGAYLLADGELQYFGKDGYFTNIYFDDLGLDSRSINLQGGRQGLYEYYIDFNQLPHYVYDVSQTPYSGVDNLVLPAGWVAANNTGSMSSLAASLQAVDIMQERETIGLGFRFIQSSRWQYAIDFNQSTLNGDKITGASFLLTSAQLPAPVDYKTDQLELTAGFTGKKLQAELAYYVSTFSNEYKSLTWQNPYLASVPGAEFGRLALAPDNNFHQISASASYLFDRVTATRLTANLSMGRMEQDDDYLPSTINSSLVTSALPQNNLDADVDTLNYNLRISSRPTRDASLSLAVEYSERDNNTPQNTYQQVVDDVFVSAAKTNVPYSFSRNKVSLRLAHRLPKNFRLAMGFHTGAYKRTLLDTSKTNDSNIWAELSASLFDMVDFRVKFADDSRRHAERDWLTIFLTQENPYLQKFNMADRERNEITASISISPIDMLAIDLTADITDDDYTKSAIGLTDAEQTSYAIDLSLAPMDKLNLYLFFAQENIESTMAGSTNFSAPDWFLPNWSAQQEDEIDTIGFGIEFEELFDKFDIGLDYNQSESQGNIQQIPIPTEAFPALTTDLKSTKLYLKYPLNQSMALRFEFLSERYKSNDWGFDNVEVDTIPNVLTLGQQVFDYDIDSISATFNYRF